MDMDTEPGPSNGHTDPAPTETSPPATPPVELEIPSDLFDDLDPDDEIAYTLPVYMTQTLSPALSLFQYPLHHRVPQVSEWAAARGQSVTARMKEHVDRFELEIPIDMRPEVWDEERAEGLGFAPEDSGKKGKGREEGWGSKMRLRSEPVPEVTGYWAGIVHDGEYV
jgi:DNA-directed RNA polymerase-3 subunit RPC5